MSLTRVLAFNTLAQYLGKGLSLIASVLVTSLLTTKLGVTGYGQYVYVFSVALIFFSFADWGSTFVAIRSAASKPDQKEIVYSTSLFLRFFVSLIIALAFFTSSYLYPSLSSLRQLVVIAAFLLPLLSLKTSFQIVFQTQLQLWRLSLIDTFGSLSFLALLFFFSPLTLTPALVLLLLLLATLFSVLLGIVLAFQLTRLPLAFNFKMAKDLFRQSIPVGILITVFSIYNRLDVLILERLTGTDPVAYYGLSYKIYENLVVGAGFLANSTFPIFAARAKSRVKFRQAFEKNLAALLLMSFFVTIASLVFSRFVVVLIAGDAFLPSVSALRLLSLSLIPAYLNHGVGYPLLALNKQRAAAFTAILALIFNATLNLIFIPIFSFNASAAITGLTEAFVLILNTYIILKVIKRIRPHKVLRYLHPKSVLSLLLK